MRFWSAVKRSANLDHHWRNIRTLASHNPPGHKARAVDDFLLDGSLLSTSGFF
ncbi:MAG: hypothetical protein AB7I01_16240 [Gammaproteobacteria bacterium]